MEQTRYRSFLLKAGYWAAIGAIVLLFFRYLLSPLMPFIIAFAVSMILFPLIRKLSEKLKIKQSFVATVLVLLTYLLAVCIVAGLLIAIASALISWASGLPLYFTNYVYPWIEEKGTELGELIVRLRPDAQDILNSILPDIVGTISGFVMDFSKNIVTWASSVGTRLPGAFLTAVICVIATVFLATDYEHVIGVLGSYLPQRVREVLRFAKTAFNTIIGNYARSYSLILLITFLQVSVGLLIIGYDNALLIALAVAIFDILPIVGSGMIFVPWIIITFITGSLGRGIGLTVLWLIVVVSRQIIEPKIVGKQVGMHPLMTLVSMWVGLKLFGGVGLFAVPITVLLITDLKEQGLIGKAARGELPKENDEKPIDTPAQE